MKSVLAVSPMWETGSPPARGALVEIVGTASGSPPWGGSPPARGALVEIMYKPEQYCWIIVAPRKGGVG